MRNLIVAFLVIFPSIAYAAGASLQSISGEILVNKGEGYSMAQAPIPLGAGDSIIANPGGSAKVVYGDGCEVKVQPGDVVTVASETPCKAGALLPSGTGAVLIAGGLAAGGIAAGIILLSGDDKPASP